jgi:Zn-dependent M28 family amino/carboxypeptidase
MRFRTAREIHAISLLVTIALFLSLLALFSVLVSQPTFHKNPTSQVTVDTARLKSHVEMLSQTLAPRDWTHPDALERCADYIARQFEEAGATVTFQPVEAEGRIYRNVIGRFGSGQGPRFILGAHYDSCGTTPGADDNASGVAVLIELARLMGRELPDREVELVAYVLEEPPFFGTARMGSAVHAKELADSAVAVRGVLVLEMVGFFTETPGSQSYPLPLLRLLYPGRGNFAAVVGRWDQGDWIKSVKAGMKGTTALPVYSIRAPAALPGVDFSDHRNYWSYGYKALMVTDTAFYRNLAYHQQSDTADRLDYGRMADVAVAVFEVVRSQ